MLNFIFLATHNRLLNNDIGLVCAKITVLNLHNAHSAYIVRYVISIVILFYLVFWRRTHTLFVNIGLLLKNLIEPNFVPPKTSGATGLGPTKPIR